MKAVGPRPRNSLISDLVNRERSFKIKTPLFSNASRAGLAK